MALIRLNNQSLTNVTALPTGVGGKVLQIQRTQFTGTNTISLNAETDTVFTDLTVNITPTASNSIIQLQAHVFGEHSVNNSNAWNHMFFFFRDTTKLGAPTAGSRLTGVSMSTLTHFTADSATTPEVVRYDFFDTPNTTSQITYKVGLITRTAENWNLNKTVNDADGNAYERGVSFISATEIAG